MTVGADTEPAAPPPGTVVTEAAVDAVDADDARSVVRRSYDQYHRRLEAGDHARHARFMNFGYLTVPGVADRNELPIPRLLPNAEGARLVGEIIGPVVLDGQAVIDVGCGRGGALWLATREPAPRVAFGFDLSAAGARAAEQTLHDRPHATAGVADAEALPVATSSIDVVLNVESSLHYPHLERFYAEVARVLRTDGTFCYGDLFHIAAGDAYAVALQACGLTIEVERDVTENVLAARRARGERQRRALDGSDAARSAGPGTDADAARFVAEPGTPFFDAMADGTLAYRLIQARRTGAPAAAPAADRRLRAAATLARALTGEFDGAS